MELKEYVDNLLEWLDGYHSHIEEAIVSGQFSDLELLELRAQLDSCETFYIQIKKGATV